jgi:phosphoribosylamine-glycine ligase
MRVILTTDQEKKKLVIANFQRLLDNEDEAIRYSRVAIEEMDGGNHKTIVAMVDNPDMVRMNMVKLDYWWRHART